MNYRPTFGIRNLILENCDARAKARSRVRFRLRILNLFFMCHRRPESAIVRPPMVKKTPKDLQEVDRKTVASTSRHVLGSILSGPVRPESCSSLIKLAPDLPCEGASQSELESGTQGTSLHLRGCSKVHYTRLYTDLLLVVPTDRHLRGRVITN